MDKVLAAWVVECEELNICISYDIIKQKALALVDRLKVEDPLKFSNGWLQKFIKRHGFYKYKLHGESGSVKMVILNSAITVLQVKIAKFDPSDVYNMDENGLFYTQAPSSTVSKRPTEGVKLDKKRITLALAANAEGSHKLPLLFIGKAKSPRCFKKKLGEALGFCYGYNKKSWMTLQLFTEWLTEFKKEMVKRKRKALLLQDNAPTHHNIMTSNVEILFLPPNITSKLQHGCGYHLSFQEAIKKIPLES